jgi:hypothetical protein
MRNMRDAWDMYRALDVAGGRKTMAPRPPRQHIGYNGGMGNIIPGGDVGSSCVVAQQWEQGYWPYPWSEMPPGGLPFDEWDSIVTPANNGIETVVLQFQIPFGYDGIILGVSNLFTGPGFVQGSGDFIWRIRIGSPSLQGRPQRNYSDIRVTLGSFQSPREVYGGIQVASEQFVEYSVTHAATSPIIPGGTRIVCNIAGFYWPRGSSPLAHGGAQ